MLVEASDRLFLVEPSQMWTVWLTVCVRVMCKRHAGCCTHAGRMEEPSSTALVCTADGVLREAFQVQFRRRPTRVGENAGVTSD